MNFFPESPEIVEKEVFPGFFGRFIHTENTTVGHIHIKKGAILPEHQHPQEQITNIISGEFEMTVGGETKLCRPGDVVNIPSNTPHSARALTECYAIDVFYPVREDYK